MVIHVTSAGEETEVESLKMGPSGQRLGNLVQDQVEKGHERLILDLGPVKQPDAGLLGGIAAGCFHARQVGGDLVLANLDSNLKRLLMLTGIEGVIPAFNSVAEAVRHFRS